MKIIVFDCETTGLIDADLIEFSCIYGDIDGNTIESKTFRMRPDKPILANSIVVHGITPEVASQYESPEIITRRIYEFLKGFSNPVLFVGHNIGYDCKIVDVQFQRHINISFNPALQLDTLRFAKHLINMDEIGGYNLDAVFYYLFPSKLSWLLKNRSSHDALTDCQITHQILIELKSRFDKLEGKKHSWGEVISHTNSPMDLSEQPWKFGKHKGILMKDTPHGYIRWCLTSDFAHDPQNVDIIYTLKKYY